MLLEIDSRVTTSKTLKKQAAALSPLRSELLLELHLDSNPESLCLVRAALQQAAEVLHFQEPDGRAIVRAVDEALANVMRHTYQGRKDRPIAVRCKRLWHRTDAKAVDGMEILLSDSGPPLDLTKLKGRALNEIRPGGLGLHFIQHSMDVVEFSRKNGKNLLRLVKYRAPSTPERKPQGE
jgi:serine/threonine-protein kinase RsbW